MEGFYSVREMTRKLGVEAHILRYWEKELKLDIPRDSQGHRIYGEEEARLLTLVSDYKRVGKPLRLIRTMITVPAQEKERVSEVRDVQEHGSARGTGDAFGEGVEAEKDEGSKRDENVDELSEEREGAAPDSQRLQDLLGRMVAQAVRESSGTMITEMKESILKELDYQFRLQEERETELRREVVEAQEDHFQRMDILLRNKSEGHKRRLWK